MPVAILDFGTNTFNLLIAEKKGNRFEVKYNGKVGVKLGKGGINKRIIAPDAMERGLEAISKHMNTIHEYGVTEIHAYATSAIRNAENGREFVQIIKKQFGFTTNVIEGEEEAALIYTGIRESIDFGTATAMILDIGGGSNEFIICNQNGILWKHSFELGMARIIEKFQISDPITNEETGTIENYYRSELALLLDPVQKFKPTILVGASGSFDTIAAMTQQRYGLKPDQGISFVEINIKHFRELYNVLLRSTTKERISMPGMEPVRLEMIVPAAIFINFVYNNFGLKYIKQSKYAMKEGVMTRLINAK